MPLFEIIPAIDLRGGQCVRLFQGDFARETVFSSDPIATARQWERLGAPRLHVVDLDGAQAGRPIQLELVARLVTAVQIPIQLGGGLRKLVDVESALRVGVERVVLGTGAIGAEDDDEARAFRLGCLARNAERVAIGLDARAGKLAVKGWTKSTKLDVLSFARLLRDEGFQRIIHTDISRDGALSGPNLREIEELARTNGLAVIASGGIRGLSDLSALKVAGTEGAIVGRALYTGVLDLQEAVSALVGPEAARRC